MLPALSQLNGLVAGEPVQVPPPPKFREPHDVWGVELLENITPKPDSLTSAQKTGLRYERRVIKWLQDEIRGTDCKVKFNPCLQFRSHGIKWRACFPDILIQTEAPPRIYIVEIKSQHTSDSWWQLRKLYEPVVRAGWPTFEPILLEICRSFNPQAPFPERFQLLSSLSELYSQPPGSLSVLPWRL